MRVAILVPELLVEGGGERQAVYLAKELQEMGHEVVVYTLAHDPRRCYPQVCAQLCIVVTGRHPLARLPIPSRRFRDYLDMRHLARRVRGPFDVINPHHWPPHWAAVWAARRISPRPAVVWMCNDPPWPPGPSHTGARRLTFPLWWLLRRALRWHDLRATRQISRIVVLSEWAKGLVDAACGSDCTVVRSGVDFQSLQLNDPEQAAELRRRYRISPDTFLLLFLGILMPHRRLEDALAGVATAVAEGHDIHFLIVGSPSEYPDYAERLRRLAEDLGIDRRVTFAGAVPENRLPLCYHACDAFIFPSENQTWSLAVTEAMACGKPAIVSTGAAVQEILETGETAFLVPPRRPDAIAAVLGEIITGPKLRAEVAKRGRQLVASNLTWRRYAGAMVSVFEAAVRLRPGEEPAATGVVPVVTGERDTNSRQWPSTLTIQTRRETFASLKALPLRLRERMTLLLGSAGAGHRIRTSHVFSALKRLSPDGRSILDAGCATGSYAIRCAATYPTSDVSGCDIDDPALRRAQARRNALGLRRLHFQRADIASDLGEARYDIILCVDVLEHVERDELALCTMRRALRPGGHLIVHVPVTQQRRFFPWLRDWHQDDHVREGYSPDSFLARLVASGFWVDRAQRTFGWAGALAWDICETLDSIVPPLRLLAFPVVAAGTLLDRQTSTTQGNGLLVIARRAEPKPAELASDRQSGNREVKA